ncbi:MAG: PDZ domain-containing protein [Verrucomicrobiae bacterium]|nr:PDZ domain-containing protein [Verrucomicrobiae bacterium]
MALFREGDGSVGRSRLFVPVELPLLGLWFARLDTGSNGTVTMDRSIPIAMSLTADFTPRYVSEASGVAGRVATLGGELSTFGIGGNRFTNFSCSTGFEGVTVGMGVIGEFNALVDVENGNLWLQSSKTQQLDRNPKIDFHGMRFAPPEMKVLLVIPEAPAAEAGIQVGDSIVKIGEVEVTLPLLQSKYAEAAGMDKTLVIVLERNGEMRSVELQPEDYFGEQRNELIGAARRHISGIDSRFGNESAVDLLLAGRLRELGIIEGSNPTAADCYKGAMDKGSLRAAVFLGRILMKAGKIDEGVALLRRAAEGVDLEAIRSLPGALRLARANETEVERWRAVANLLHLPHEAAATPASAGGADSIAWASGFILSLRERLLRGELSLPMF